MEAAAGAATDVTEAERRQLTVVFVDLVGSTELSHRLDPEDLRDVMRRYQDAVAGCIARYDGYLAKFLGDGVLAYFGWPQAYEEQAERAVRSGLAAVAAIADIELEDRSTLRGRVGIATGEVVIGDIVGEASTQSEAVVGETPNLAARLQTMAEPDQLVIGSTTRRLIGDLFDYRDLGLKSLKGIADPVPAWQVLGERTVESRFEAAHTGKLTSLVGREHELGLLLDRWMLAKGGEGQVVLLSGEAGIGKSRMVQALREHVCDQAHFRLRYQCSPYHSNSAFYPIIQRLERAAGFFPGDTTDAKLDKLEKLLELTTEDIETIAPFFAALLSLPSDDRYGSVELTPQQRRDQLIETLIDQLLALSRQRPVLFVLEDAHWIDPTTEDLLGEIMPLIADESVFMLITYRPSYTPPWASHAHLTSIVLNRLGREQGAAIVRSAGGSRLVDGVVERIVVRAGGVPLYIEEITKSVVEAVAFGDETLAEDRIPETLQASLIARLDRLGEAKEITQMSAVIGREFSHALLAAVADESGVEVDTALDRLVQSELVLRRGAPPNATYTFKHALVQEAAYETLLKRTRQQYHRQVARLLEERFGEIVDTQPELVAHHYAQAGDSEHAVNYWQKAGQRASEHSANLEAIAHLTKGLDLVKSLPETPERDRQELDLLITLGPALMSTKGNAALEVEQAYLRARELCQQMEEPSQLFAATWGLWFFYEQSAQFETAQRLADELLALAERQSDPALLLQAHHAAWTIPTCDLSSYRYHTEQGIALYDINKHRTHAVLYGGHDPGVCCRIQAAMCLWYLGYAEQALEKAHEAVTLADELSHPFSTAIALAFSAFIHQYRGEVDLTRERAEATMALCAEQGFAQWLAVGNILRGWAVAAKVQANEGIAKIEQGIITYRATGAKLRVPHYLTLLAEAYRLTGQAEQGLSALAEALELFENIGEQRWETEIYRVKGELLMWRSAENRTEAEACFHHAIEVAHRQSAMSLELRAATSLARLWCDHGESAEARDLLTPVYDWFTEGFDTGDLKVAKELLDELS
jgi:class 3 adenylate cyclase/predicted ATPase